MATIRIVTDSTAGITEAQKEELGIATIPLVVRFGSDAYRDGIEISSGEFYDRLITGNTFPSTSQPSAGEFLELYRELAEDADSIISIHISSKLSGTCESARTAIREEIDATVDVIDSQSVATGLGHLAVVAAEMARHGSDRDIIIQAINKLIPKVRIGFALTTLEYLKRGGKDRRRPGTSRVSAQDQARSSHSRGSHRATRPRPLGEKGGRPSDSIH